LWVFGFAKFFVELKPHRFQAPLPEQIAIATPDGLVDILVRASPRATRASLRVDPSEGGVVLVVPARMPFSQAQAFAESQALWIAGRQRLAHRRVRMTAGAEVPILGAPHRVVLAATGRPVSHVDGEIRVTGEPDHTARRVRDYLRRLALCEIAPRAERFAHQVDRSIARISIRDPKTRWASCSSSGDLSFSWRLIMAPEPILTYVVAHEIAHRVEMNHSPRFWRVVEQLGVDAKSSRAWLKAEGPRLLRYD
jgi:predicted metal-dependent hydrolase